MPDPLLSSSLPGDNRLPAPFPWFGGKRAIAAQVWQWLGHEGLLTQGWRKWIWTANGGYGNQRPGGGNENRQLEACWVSPHCLQEATAQLDLFATGGTL